MAGQETKLRNLEIRLLTLNKNVPLRTEILIDDRTSVSDESLEKLRQNLGNSSLVTRASDIKEEVIQSSPSPHVTKRSLEYGESVIVDYGGIGNLVDAVPYENQRFSTVDIASSLVESELVDSNKNALKMGAAGAVIDGIAAEVIKMQLIKGSRLTPLTKVSFSRDGQIMTDRTTKSERVLLENEFIVQPVDKKDSKAIFVKLKIDDSVDIYQLLAKACTEAGIENYTIRGTVYGPVEASIAVIKELPKQPVVNTEGVKEILVVGNQVSDSMDNQFHFFGSRSNAPSRKNEKWGEITGNNVYSPLGHWHGYSESGQMGGHIRSLNPKKGSIVELIIESAKVVQVVKS